MKNKINLNNKWISLCLGILSNILLFIPEGLYIELDWRFILIVVVGTILYAIAGGIILFLKIFILYALKIKKENINISNIIGFITYSLYIGFFLHILSYFYRFLSNLH